MRFSALFGEVFGQTALSSIQLLKGNFSGASLSYREDARNEAYGFPFISNPNPKTLRLREKVQSRA